MSKNIVKKFLAGIAAVAMVGAAIPSDSFKSVFNSDFYDYEVSAAESKLTILCGFTPPTVDSLPAGTKVAFIPSSVSATLNESDCLFNLPTGSAILETTNVENNSKKQAESYATSNGGTYTLNNYVNVKQAATGFDTCMKGGLFNEFTTYFCYGGGVTNYPGKSYAYEEKTGEAYAKLDESVVVECHSTDDTTISKDKITVTVACDDGTSFVLPQELYTLTDSTINPSKFDSTITIQTGGQSFTLEVTFVHQDLTLVSEGTPATCTQTGEKAYYSCSYCTERYEAAGRTAPKYDAEGNVITDITLPVLSHSYANGVNPEVQWIDGHNKAKLLLDCDMCGSASKGEITIDSNGIVEDGIVNIPENAIDKNSCIITSTSTQTCVNKGYTKYTATFIINGKTYKYNERIYNDAPKPHDFNEVNAASATCTKDGHKSYYFCDNCDQYFVLDENGEKVAADYEKDIKIPATGHSYVKHNAVEADCTHDGNKEYYSCSNCSSTFLEDENGNKTEVDYESKINIPCLNHNLSKHDEVPATCTEDGHIEYYVCANESSDILYDAEGNVITDIVLPKTGHSYNTYSFEWVKDEDSDDNAQKCIMSVECDKCGETLEYYATLEGVESEDSSGQSYTGNVTDSVVGSCDAEGKRMYKATFVIETVKGEKKYTASTIKSFPALGHNLVYVPAKEATCTEAGCSAHYECDRCGKTFSDCEGKNEIDPIKTAAHNLVYIDEKAPTCTETGVKAHYECSVCGQKFADEHGNTPIEEDTVIPATGHKFTETSDSKIIWDDADMTKSYALVECDICHKMCVFHLNADESSKTDIVPASCTESGYSEYNAVFEYDGTTIDDTTKTKVIGKLFVNAPVTEHQYDKNGVCTNCHSVLTDVSVENIGDVVSQNKTKIQFKATAGEIPDGYSILKTGVYFTNGQYTDHKVGKDNSATYKLNITDDGSGVKVTPYVIVKNDKTSDTYEIKGEEITDTFTMPTIEIENNGEVISQSKNKLNFKVTADVNAEAFTITDIGVFFLNGENNASLTKENAQTLGATNGHKTTGDNTYKVNITDNGYGVSAFGYVKVTAVDGRTLTFYTDVVNDEFTKPEVEAAFVKSVISQGKKKVQFKATSLLPDLGYTIVKTGVYFDSTSGNSIYNIESRLANSSGTVTITPGKADSLTYTVNITDNYYGVTVMPYTVVKDTQGNEFTITGEPIHAEYEETVN